MAGVMSRRLCQLTDSREWLAPHISRVLSVGAIGLMQLMPATAASMKVGDISHPDPNVHAGAQYMRQLVDKYFPDANFDEQNRTLFPFASYNAGPGRDRSDAEARDHTV
jgi:membrane-bound lytic murein transglycosylase MltF